MAAKPKRFHILDKTKIKILDTKDNQVILSRVKVDSEIKNRIITGSSDSTIKLRSCDENNLDEITLQGHINTVTCLLAYGSSTLISGSSDRKLKIWNLKLFICTKTLEGHLGSITCLVLIPNRSEFLSASQIDKTMRIWNISTGECLKVVRDIVGATTCLLFISSSHFVSASWDRLVY